MNNCPPKYLRNSVKIIPYPPHEQRQFSVYAYVYNDKGPFPRYLVDHSYVADSEEECRVWCDFNGLKVVTKDEEWEQVFNEYMHIWSKGIPI